ncbi:hypothetical protein O6R05_06100 [Peptoniphilus equinus]|uniref:Uncharacterized protein n=1 Tax=Peptoniphilus equinus TaxID=3016343 RepID=A0ABY7QRZ2_9FIRM|nr:hypothetical protein [Peptoniphilus equinus]WBW49566.1 hypothetical protein O6R05_06100 [Peptoniphilus equinus]
MKVKYIGESDPVYMINSHIYDVISLEEGWYRIIDEEGVITDIVKLEVRL